MAWSVFSVLDGQLVARVPFLSGTQSATRIGTRAYCLTSGPARGSLADGPPGRVSAVHAIDLEEGKVAWTRSLGAAVTASRP